MVPLLTGDPNQNVFPHGRISVDGAHLMARASSTALETFLTGMTSALFVEFYDMLMSPQGGDGLTNKQTNYVDVRSVPWCGVGLLVRRDPGGMRP